MELWIVTCDTNDEPYTSEPLTYEEAKEIAGELSVNGFLNVEMKEILCG